MVMYKIYMIEDSLSLTKKVIIQLLIQTVSQISSEFYGFGNTKVCMKIILLFLKELKNEAQNNKFQG